MNDLLDLDDIAALYRVPRRHARDFIAKQPGFPEPVPGSSGRFRRWSAAEIRAFINRRPAKSVRPTLKAA